MGMGADVLAASAAARAVFERVDEALGEPLSRLILEGPEEKLTLTANSQPAILATRCAILAAVRERLPDLAQPAFAAGHSLGEYSALVAAEALSLEDAVRRADVIILGAPHSVYRDLHFSDDKVVVDVWGFWPIRQTATGGQLAS